MNTSHKKYDVALSFASEDRKFVEEVAVVLVLSKIDVFYDRFEEIDLWGKNLYEHLECVYRDLASYAIIFCSKHYAEKAWTRHEHRAAQERAIKERREYVLPLRFDDTAIPGLPETTAYLDISEMMPYDVAQRIGMKIGRAVISASAYHLSKTACPFCVYCDLVSYETPWCYDTCKQYYGWDCRNCGAQFEEHGPGLAVDGVMLMRSPNIEPDISRTAKRDPDGIYPGSLPGRNHSRIYFDTE